MNGLRSLLICALVATATPFAGADEAIELQLRYQKETSPDSGRYHRLTRTESWDPRQTAVIVCDVWDLHHCLNAVRREEELAPRLNQVIEKLRQQGVTVIHAPSDCMDAYADHPGRKRAQATPKAAKLPADITSWCSRIPAEERGVYPIDQSDGGEDDDPKEHAEWAAKLQAMGRNPRAPWKKQSDLITIDADRDYISDKGDEVWSILEQKGIQNVILTGVHTNMCVLGRPFGLRQMAQNGKNVVLMRDMTDTMYNPARWPYVSHFTGTDLIVSHIEKFVCPTITSDQILGGTPFRFKNDKRPHVVFIMAEQEYDTERTLPAFAGEQLGKEFRVSYVFADDSERNNIPGLEVLDDADVVVISVRRRLLPPDDMEHVRQFIKQGKSVVGIRTASHAFSLGNKPVPEGFADWPQFDAEVFGGNYHGHHRNDLPSTVTVVEPGKHPILQGLPEKTFPQAGSLYKTSPLAAKTQVLLQGTAEGHDPEPVAWVYRRADGGLSFYTSLGHKGDFDNPSFVRLLLNAIRWSAKLDGPPIAITQWVDADDWSLTVLPASPRAAVWLQTKTAWYRCAVRVPKAWAEGHDVVVSVPGAGVQVWWNGTRLQSTGDGDYTYPVPTASIQVDDANLVVVRVPEGSSFHEGTAAVLAGDRSLSLQGEWQWRAGDDPSWSDLPLPAKFAVATNIVFEPETLFEARPLTKPGEFTTGIEGPACDADGNIYAVNYARQGTIGRVTPQGEGEIFVELPDGSIGNGIRFDTNGVFYVADYTGHNVLRVEPKTKKVDVFAHNAEMSQPNDLAIAADGTLYASDPNWSQKTGRIWRISGDGKVTLVAEGLGTTNGIEVRPDGRTLYVNESVQRNVWAFPITADGSLGEKTLLRKFEDHGFDGMRCDVDGNLYITRHGKGTVVKLSPKGEILQEIDVLGKSPTNICFGGPDGRTAYVTEVEHRRLVQFRVDRPGLSWSRRATN